PDGRRPAVRERTAEVVAKAERSKDNADDARYRENGIAEERREHSYGGDLDYQYRHAGERNGQQESELVHARSVGCRLRKVNLSGRNEMKIHSVVIALSAARVCGRASPGAL